MGCVQETAKNMFCVHAGPQECYFFGIGLVPTTDLGGGQGKFGGNGCRELLLCLTLHSSSPSLQVFKQKPLQGTKKQRSEDLSRALDSNALKRVRSLLTLVREDYKETNKILL